jgi:DNA-binding IclR family transcriptional regulator
MPRKLSPQPHPDYDRVFGLMHKWRKEGAMWTKDIAYAAGLPTPRAHLVLKGLLRRGKVRRVASGNPVSWEVVDQS